MRPSAERSENEAALSPQRRDALFRRQKLAALARNRLTARRMKSGAAAVNGLKAAGISRCAGSPSISPWRKSSDEAGSSTHSRHHHRNFRKCAEEMKLCQKCCAKIFLKSRRWGRTKISKEKADLIPTKAGMENCFASPVVDDFYISHQRNAVLVARQGSRKA